MPRLSIVVPVVDEAAGIADALAPLQALRERGAEVIVVDGGSRDATPSIARPLADRALVAPRGRAVQMNVGASVASGDVLLFLHADCRLPDDAIPAIERALATGAKWGRFDVTLAGRSAMLPVVARMMNVRSRLTGIATGDQGLFVTRGAFDAVGGFPALPLMEDVSMSGALRSLAGRPACIASRIEASGRRWDVHGASRTIATMWSLRHAFRRGADPAALHRRYYGRAPEPPAILQVFAKPPLPGRVKTRLARSIGDEAAVNVYAALVRRTLRIAADARRAGVVRDVELWVAPGEPPGVLQDWANAHGFALRAQQGRDLGERMQHALRDALARGSRAVLVGTDVPGYDVRYFAAAVNALQDRDAVFGPAEDGGYVLVGLARDVDAFDGVPWSTADVMRVTRVRLAAAAASWHELEPLWDVDTVEDFDRWRAADGMRAGERVA